MAISTQQILRVLYILSWIIFIGICINAGGAIFSAFYTSVINPLAAKNFWGKTDLSSLYQYHKGYFWVIIFFITVPLILKAVLFYRIVTVLHNKKLNFTQPFTNEIKSFLFKMSYIAVLIGILSLLGAKYAEWIGKKGIQIPDAQSLGLLGADVWLFMAVILFIVAQMFKKGIEIQSENELTI